MLYMSGNISGPGLIVNKRGIKIPPQDGLRFSSVSSPSDTQSSGLIRCGGDDYTPTANAP